MSDNLEKYNSNHSDKELENECTVVYEKSTILNEFSSNNKTTDSGNFNSKSEKRILKEKSKRNTYIFRSVWIVMVVLISALTIKYILVGINDMLAISRENQGEKVVVEIPDDANINNVSNALLSAGVIKDKSFFTLYSIFTKSSRKFTKGTYEITIGSDYEAIVNYLQTQSNRTDIIDVSFPEGKNIIEYAKILSDNGVCGYDEFLEACNSDYFDDDYEFISNIKNSEDRYYKLEGYLFPDTYTFYQGENPKSAITRFLNNFEEKIFKKKSVKGYTFKINIESIAEEKGMSLNDLIILSSLIQAEAADTDDMYYVSSVFHNRLKTLDSDGQSKFGEFGLNRLESDATLWYPFKSKNDIPSDRLNEFPGKYDTYKIPGLTVGPICNPGLDAIDAALNPKDTEYYYFCHSNDGNSYYAKIDAEHQQNLVKAGLK